MNSLPKGPDSSSSSLISSSRELRLARDQRSGASTSSASDLSFARRCLTLFRALLLTSCTSSNPSPTSSPNAANLWRRSLRVRVPGCGAASSPMPTPSKAAISSAPPPRLPRPSGRSDQRSFGSLIRSCCVTMTCLQSRPAGGRTVAGADATFPSCHEYRDVWTLIDQPRESNILHYTTYGRKTHAHEPSALQSPGPIVALQPDPESTQWPNKALECSSLHPGFGLRGPSFAVHDRYKHGFGSSEISTAPPSPECARAPVPGSRHRV